MKSVYALALVPVLLTACGLNSSLGGAAIPQEYPLNAVKLVSPSIQNGNDPSAMVQMNYDISNSSQLLIRLGDLLDKTDSILIGNGKAITLEVDVTQASDAATAQTELQVCPLLKDWMMYATWNVANPYAHTFGIWSHGGGDYDPSSCIAVTSVSNTTTLNFDVSSWFTNYVKGRQVNYGLVLISSSATAISIRGDADAYKAPRFHWFQ